MLGLLAGLHFALMAVVAVDPRRLAGKEHALALAEVVRRKRERKRAASDPGFFIDKCRMVNQDDGTPFFTHLTEPAVAIPAAELKRQLDSGEITEQEYYRRICLEVPWGYQWDFVYRNLMENARVLVYKARQMGFTWITCAWCLHAILYKSGINVLFYRQKKRSAQKALYRVWVMLKWIEKNHPHLMNGCEIVVPERAARPTDELTVRHPDGQLSSIFAQAATDDEGLGETTAILFIDELSKVEKARDIYNNNVPTISRNGQFIGVFTPFGVSNTETGEGNFGHYAWSNAEALGLAQVFYPWYAPPDRQIDGKPDYHWYETETNMTGDDRLQAYPGTPEEGFISSGTPFFDRAAMAHYRENVRGPLYRFWWDEVGCDFGAARFAKIDERGTPVAWSIHVFEEPKLDVDYAIYADVSKGTSSDYSVIYVVNLFSGQIAAQGRGKLGYDELAAQLYYTGHWYGATPDDPRAEALICPERNAGGEAVVLALRTGGGTLGGESARPAYHHIYRHADREVKGRPQKAGDYGYPIGKHTRSHILSQLAGSLRDHDFDFLPSDALLEIQTFVRFVEPPSPRADKGCNDDCVMALAGAIEMLRQQGYSATTGRSPSGQLTNYRPPPVGAAMIRR